MQKINTDLLIIGGGTAGLVTALDCQDILSVTLIDAQEILGKKWRLAGGAMGNMTNRTINADHYVSHNPKQAKKLLQSLFKSWQTEQTLAFMHDMGMDFEERDYGQIFCKKPVKNLIETLIQSLTKTNILLSQKIQSYFYHEENGEKCYTIKTQSHEITCKKLLIATGSPAYPQIGASDFALRLAQKWGHNVFAFRPALVPLLLPQDSPLLGLEGINLPVRIKVLAERGKEKTDPCGIRPLLFTHTGISGPASLVISCLWQEGETLCIDFLPSDNLLEKMHDTANGKKLVKNLILPLLPDRLAYALMPQTLQDKKIAELSKKERKELVNAIHHFSCIPAGVDSFKKAEACLGGIAINEISLHLESTLHKNLYFAGECLDITGLLGGYNIHFALACAHKIANKITTL